MRRPHDARTRHTLHGGDCLDVLRGMADHSVDAVVTDPPYGLGFMGKAWDALPPGVEWARECLRVLKPGGHLIAFGGQRTIHRLATALEDGGFQIRDLFGWLFWTGFPKSLNLGDGWGTALKPAMEPAVIAVKPREGTYADNVQAWGVGGINIDACRYGYGDPAWPGPNDEASARAKHASVVGLAGRSGGVAYGEHAAARTDSFRAEGRWPANVYYCPKPARREREAGCEDLRQASAGELTGGRAEGSDGLKSPRAGAGRTSKGRGNVHPTVKPLRLMRWLVRLVTPPGGVVLDPFLGSGTTMIAAELEGVRCIGIEREDRYREIVRARMGAIDELRAMTEDKR